VRAARAGLATTLLKYLAYVSEHVDALLKCPAYVKEHEENRSKHGNDVSLLPKRHLKTLFVVSEQQDDVSEETIRRLVSITGRVGLICGRLGLI
jgi:hypothetical protein